jgi:hypothetical protein
VDVADIIGPETVRDPVIDVFVFTLNPVKESDALTDPVAICDKFNPLTLPAGILVKPLPSPLNEPVKTDAVIEPDILCIEPYNSINIPFYYK